MAVNLSTAVKKANKQRLFGQTFQYQDIFLGKIEEEFVTIEEFISGEFIKYIKTLAKCVGIKMTSFVKKLNVCPIFSFEKSDKKLMIVDIQGSGANLYAQRLQQWSCWQMEKYYFVQGTY